MTTALGGNRFCLGLGWAGGYVPLGSEVGNMLLHVASWCFRKHHHVVVPCAASNLVVSIVTPVGLLAFPRPPFAVVFQSSPFLWSIIY